MAEFRGEVVYINATGYSERDVNGAVILMTIITVVS